MRRNLRHPIGRDSHARAAQGLEPAETIGAGRDARRRAYRGGRDDVKASGGQPPLTSHENELDSTRTLLERARQGNAAAVETLVRRFRPALERWAHGQIPRRLRGLEDTGDLVQITFIKALGQLDGFDYIHRGGFFSFLRTVLKNEIVDHLRRAQARPEGESLPLDLQDPGRSPLEETIGVEVLERYEAALAQLTPQQRDAVVLRIEFGLSFQEVADAIGCPTANAARMLVTRAIVRVSEVLDDPR